MKTKFAEEKILIDTYPEAKREELPMFAKNRVHQRTSGNPYPNKVVLEAQREVREKREYTLLKLENEFLEIGILPALGGKILYARDKKNDYDFFYRNHVVKPALIGVLGSWTSGGLEFNWPFHHRASTFMPVDYSVETRKNGITVWLSEHDPIDRMKGMVGISLNDGECAFETLMKLDNTRPVPKSFLWWENAAVPVNEKYSIFFPEDVNYVRFHYKRSVTEFPIANNRRFGAYNGFLFDGDTDISKHKNTHPATSYFSAESKFDYFGGYDYGKQAGVVHIADRHISPGKKMFTWGYNQLSHTWERALTDTDGQYAELMAGCYSDNQPDLSWLAPYEYKKFKTQWYPIHGHGTPLVANENGALFEEKGELIFMSVRPEKKVTVSLNGKETAVSLPVYDCVSLGKTEGKEGEQIVLRSSNRTLLSYTFSEKQYREIPQPRKELPYFKEVQSAEELYFEGLHAEQYRSPEYRAEKCYEESLLRDPFFTPSLVALAKLRIEAYDFIAAEGYANRAVSALTRFNARTESGKAYYYLGLSLLGQKRFGEGYDALARAAWCADFASPAYLHLGMLDLREHDYSRAAERFSSAMQYGAGVVAQAYYGYALWLAGDRAGAGRALAEALRCDPLNLYAKFFLALTEKQVERFGALLNTDATQNVLDLAEYLLEAGLKRETVALIDGVGKVRPLGAMAQYVKKWLTGGNGKITANEGIAFPSRSFEKEILHSAIAKNARDYNAKYLLGCLYYAKGDAAQAEAEFLPLSKAGDYRAQRNLAVIAYSHDSDSKRAAEYMKLARKNAPKGEKQIAFESAYLMAKTLSDPLEIAAYLESTGFDRDDLTVELARAYNHAGMPERALGALQSRNFVACEGGEHYIADQYMYAYYLIGERKYRAGDFEGALEAFRKACVLPESLGAGLWNEAKKAPFRYFEAACLEKLNREKEAEEIYRSFLEFRFDYFSDMYLVSLVYFVARALVKLGEGERAKLLVHGRLSEFERAAGQESMGYFGTTPFFISFIDDAKRARSEYYAYPLYLLSVFLKDEARAEKYAAQLEGEGYGLYIKDFTL